MAMRTLKQQKQWHNYHAIGRLTSLASVIRSTARLSALNGTSIQSELLHMADRIHTDLPYIRMVMGFTAKPVVKLPRQNLD